MLSPPLAGATLVTFSAVGWVIVGVGVVIALATARVTRRAWAGQHTFLAMENPPPGWPWSAPLWRGYVRALALLPPAWWLTLATVVAFRLTPNRHGTVIIPAAVLAAAWVIVCFGILPSIVLFAAPQRLIPPAVRGRPGAVAEWRQARRRAHARR